MATDMNAGARPDFKRREYTAALPIVQLCRDLMAGTTAIHDGGTKYLPKHPGEDQADYQVRASLTEVFRAFARTVQAAVGMIHATPPKIDDKAHATLKSDWEDIDGQGTHAEVFSKQLTEDGITDGVAAILVDYPPVPADVTLSLEQENALGLRPFWVKVLRSQIVSWIVEAPDWVALMALYLSGGIAANFLRLFTRQVITRQVVIHEPTDVRDGEYGVKTVDRYRILTLTSTGVAFEVKEKQQDERGNVTFTSIASGYMRGAKGAPLPAIPLAVGYFGRKSAPFVADPALLPLAELNIGHYRVSADRRYMMKICHAPTFVITGIDEEEEVDNTGQTRKREWKIGPNRVLVLPPEHAKAEWVAADPGALSASKEEKDDLLRQMAAVGMSFIAKEQRGQLETAQGRRLDAAAENATHATAARGLQDMLEQALMFHAAYRGVEAPEVTVNTSYAAADVDASVAAILWEAVQADRLDLETLFYYLRTGTLPDDLDLDALQLELMARKIADEDLGGGGAAGGGDPADKRPPAQPAAA